MPPPTKQTVNFTFQDPSGAPLAGGRVELRLSVDISTAATSGPQVAARRLTTNTLDNSGSCSVAVWPNSSLSPQGTTYRVTAYTAQGQCAWQGEIVV